MLNIKNVEMGYNALSSIYNHISGKTVILTSPNAFRASGLDASCTPGEIIFVESADERYLSLLFNKIRGYDCVIGLGGGLVLDCAKYLAWVRGIKLVLVPTVITTNAFATEASGLRRCDHTVKYIGNARMDSVILDFDLLRTAPNLTRSGICDVLSCHTATWDWRNTIDTERPFRVSAYYKALNLVERIQAYADDIYHLTDTGLKVLIETNMATVEICQPLGHFRAEEGSEHFWFYNLESITQHGYVHGKAVGLGIYLMSYFQRNEADEIRNVLRRTGTDVSLAGMGVDYETFEKTLVTLEKFNAEQGFWPSVISNGLDKALMHDLLEEAEKNGFV